MSPLRAIGRVCGGVIGERPLNRGPLELRQDRNERGQLEDRKRAALLEGKGGEGLPGAEGEAEWRDSPRVWETWGNLQSKASGPQIREPCLA